MFLILVIFGIVLFTLSAQAQQTINEIGGYKLIVPLPIPPLGLQGAAPEKLAEYVRFLYLWFMGVVALAAGIMVTVGGVRYLLAEGNPGKEQDAKDQISHALLGLIVALGSYLILNTINPSLVNLGGSELPTVNAPVSQTFQGTNVGGTIGLCFPKSELGTNGCADIGLGWLDHPEGQAGCYNACDATTQLCCLCVGDCDATEHSCVKLDPEVGAPKTPDDLGVCGPYLREDCNGKCPADFPDCEPGNYCGDPVSQTLSFQITMPQKPSGGNTVTPVTLPEGAPLMITVQAPDTLDMVTVAIFDPAGVKAGEVPCTPSGGNVWTCQWQPTVPPSAGTWRIQADGRDASGTVQAGMTDSTRVCFSCGPIASFNVNPAIKNGVREATACTGFLDTYAVGPNGNAAILVFDASGSSSFGANTINTYQWSDNSTQLAINPLGAKIVEIPLTIGTHEIKLTVIDTDGASGEATKNITVVQACT